MPVLIGAGIPLFGRLQRDIALKHVATRHYATGLSRVNMSWRPDIGVERRAVRLGKDVRAARGSSRALGRQDRRNRMVQLVGPGGAGKTTIGAALAERLARDSATWTKFIVRHGDISAYLDAHGYEAYAEQNVALYLDWSARSGSISWRCRRDS